MARLGQAGWPVRLALIIALALALVVGGFVLGWRIAPTSTSETAIGRVSFDVRPSLSGEATAVIPVADWGFRADAFDSPFELRAELRSLERSALTRAAEGDLSTLAETEEQLRSGAQAAVLRAFAWGVGGAVALLVVATLVLRDLRPRWVLVATGVALTALLGAASLAAARSSFDASAFERPTYFANGSELERILEIAEDERAASQYGSTFASILRSVSTILADVPGPATPGRDLYLGSDLHANALVIQPLSELIGEGPFVLAGDFGQRGGVAEARLFAPRIAALGSGVIATSGNHDTSGLMDALAARGVEVLGDGVTRSPGEAEVLGLRVAGFPDPLEWTGAGDPQERPVTFADLDDPAAAAETALAELIEEFDSLRPTPDVVIVHQEGLARGLAEALYERDYAGDLTILTGHTHSQLLERFGSIIVVNGGSVGAGGIFDAGREPIGLAQLHFEPFRPVLRSVDLISIEPFSGEAQASRVVVDSLCPDEARCAFEPPGVASPVPDQPEADL
jgi:Icc-related predicted phosphoesterase